MVKEKEQYLNQTFLPACSEGAFEYAGQSFLLHELTQIAITKATKRTTANFFIKNTILFITKIYFSF